MSEKRTYYDEINDTIVSFYSNAQQGTIDALSFVGEWCDVKKILLEFGYRVIENSNVN